MLIEMGPPIVLYGENKDEQKPAIAALENSDDAIGTGIQDVLKDGKFTKTDHPQRGDMPIVARELMHPDARNNAANILTDLKTQLPGCPTECTTDVLERLLVAPWPGNVREMRNVLERAMILARGQSTIGWEQLPPDLRQRAPTDRRYQAQSLSEMERQHIERTLRHHGGNRTRAALELGISRATLINKIKAYALHL